MFSVRLQRTLGSFQLDAAFETERDTGVLVVAGVSGAGKSSVLRCIAGLERPDHGRIVVGGRVLFDRSQGIDVPIHRRRVGVVFQDSRLFPHLSVVANLRYGIPRGREHLVQEADVVDLLGIGHLLDRRPGALSGGERQRVAIGRALLTSPDLLLMDEPLASLDAARKREVLPFLSALPRRFSVPIVYVTHSLDELLQMADELVVMEKGRVVAHGAVADTIAALGAEAGLDAVVEGRVDAASGHRGVRVTPDLWLHVLGLDDLAPGDRVRMRIPADDVMVAVGEVPPMSVRNRLPARVARLRAGDRGTVVDLTLDGAPGVVLYARVSRGAVASLDLRPGMPVTALVKAAGVRVPGVGPVH